MIFWQKVQAWLGGSREEVLATRLKCTPSSFLVTPSRLLPSSLLGTKISMHASVQDSSEEGMGVWIVAGCGPFVAVGCTQNNLERTCSF